MSTISVKGLSLNFTKKTPNNNNNKKTLWEGVCTFYFSFGR
jgi:hypothetical protein